MIGRTLQLFKTGLGRKAPTSTSEERRRETRLRCALRTAGNVVFALLLLLMATAAFLLIQSRCTGGVSTVFGYRFYVVLSGSMSPTFDTGSLIAVRQTGPEAIALGDVITFRSVHGSEKITTHRVVGIEQGDGLKFITRGDACKVNDPNPTPAKNLIGRVCGAVPFIGYPLGFISTRPGLIIFVFIPSILISLSELYHLWGRN